MQALVRAHAEATQHVQELEARERFDVWPMWQGDDHSRLGLLERAQSGWQQKSEQTTLMEHDRADEVMQKPADVVIAPANKRTNTSKLAIAKERIGVAGYFVAPRKFGAIRETGGWTMNVRYLSALPEGDVYAAGDRRLAAIACLSLQYTAQRGDKVFDIGTHALFLVTEANRRERATDLEVYEQRRGPHLPVSHETYIADREAFDEFLGNQSPPPPASIPYDKLAALRQTDEHGRLSPGAMDVLAGTISFAREQIERYKAFL